MLSAAKNLWVKMLTRPLKSEEDPSPYNPEKHFWKLYQYRVLNLEEKFLDLDIVLTKRALEKGACSDENLEKSIRKMMNGVGSE